MSETLEQAIERCGAATERRMLELLPERAPAILRETVDYHLRTGGKRLRPALCLLTCEALGGAADDALDYAAAVELLHNMFLVHDDVEDGDTVRRDQPTMWVKYGIAHAVNAGDYLFALAEAAVLRTPGDDALRARLLEVFNAATLRTVEGQALDIECRASVDWSVERYRELVTLKTGYYLALGMVGGALIAGADNEAVEHLWRFGRTAGPAFQIRDDVLDLTPGKGRGGMIGSDIREGKASVLYAHALQHAEDGDRATLVDIMSRDRDDTTDADVQWVVDLYESTGAVGFARKEAEKLLDQARAEIDALPLVDTELLTALTGYMIERAT